jgi:mannobiose 2-epimerase
MPYWYDTAQDRTNGGYILSDSIRKKRPATEKQIVTQSRLLWTFSHVHRKGYSTAQRDYLRAAEHGYDFLIENFLDKNNGGYYWTTSLSGKILNNRKILYGQVFVMLSLVEYYRASNDAKALCHAMELYRILQEHAYDKRNGGWIEHFTQEWKPILQPIPEAVVEIAGFKSANTHLHLMEALTELSGVRRDNQLKESLDEALRLNTIYFYPKAAGRSCLHRQLDWKEVASREKAGLSYGHNVEFAWLMIRAQRVLGMPRGWDHFYAHLNHALKFGYDYDRGGLYACGEDDKPATVRHKVWWAQAELLAALTDALVHRPNADYETALKKLLDFVANFMVDPIDGVWLDFVAADGRLQNPDKASNWKDGYHDVRAMVKFIEAFSGSPAHGT